MSIGQASDDVIRGLAQGDTVMLSRGGFAHAEPAIGGLDRVSMIKLAASSRWTHRPASYSWQVNSALEQGVSADDLVGLLIAIAPQVGGPRAVHRRRSDRFVTRHFGRRRPDAHVTTEPRSVPPRATRARCRTRSARVANAWFAHSVRSRRPRWRATHSPGSRCTRCGN